MDRLTTEALEPFNRSGGENPYTLQYELQETMHNLVGIIRVRAELEEARSSWRLKLRRAKVSVEGHRQFNPGWHLALDLESLLTVSEAVARCALLREESRGGHTRDDFRLNRDYWAKINNTIRRARRRPADHHPGAPPPDARRAESPLRGGPNADDQVNMKVWRGDARGGDFNRLRQDREGEVVLDVIHRIQATRPEIWSALELQGREVRLVHGRGQRLPPAHVHDPDEHSSPVRTSPWRP